MADFLVVAEEGEEAVVAVPVNNKINPLSSVAFKEIYSRVPRLCIEVVIQNEKGVLLTLRKHQAFNGKWHFPGGTVFFRETLEQAVKRIAKDELGIDVSVEELLGYLEYFSEVKERGYGYSVGLAFLCQTDATSFVLNDQASEVQFFTEIPENTVVEQKELLEFMFTQTNEDTTV